MTHEERPGTHLPSPGLEFSEAARGGRLAFQNCENCGISVFPPRVLCPGCGESGALASRTSAGVGTVFAASSIPARRAAPGRHVALIDMHEGFRVMAAVVSAPDAAPGIGDVVRVDFSGKGTNLDGLPPFVLAEEA